MVRNLPTMQETRVQSLGWEDPLEEGNGNPLQYSCLENSMDRGAWWATVHGVIKSRTRLTDSHTHTHTHMKHGGNRERWLENGDRGCRPFILTHSLIGGMPHHHGAPPST